MAFPLSFPSSPPPLKVTVRRRTVAAAATNPFNLREQVQSARGARWEIDVQMPVMDAADADTWTQWLYDLQGRVGTFTFNLDPYCPGMSPAPGTLIFRLATGEVGWDVELAQLWGFRFTAVQEVPIT